MFSKMSQSVILPITLLTLAQFNLLPMWLTVFFISCWCGAKAFLLFQNINAKNTLETVIRRLRGYQPKCFMSMDIITFIYEEDTTFCDLILLNSVLGKRIKRFKLDVQYMNHEDVLISVNKSQTYPTIKAIPFELTAYHSIETLTKNKITLTENVGISRTFEIIKIIPNCKIKPSA